PSVTPFAPLVTIAPERLIAPAALSVTTPELAALSAAAVVVMSFPCELVMSPATVLMVKLPPFVEVPVSGKVPHAEQISDGPAFLDVRLDPAPVICADRMPTLLPALSRVDESCARNSKAPAVMLPAAVCVTLPSPA